MNKNNILFTTSYVDTSMKQFHKDSKSEHRYSMEKFPAINSLHRPAGEWRNTEIPCDSSAASCSQNLNAYIFPLSRITKSGKTLYAKQNPIVNFKDVSYSDDKADLLNDDYSSEEDKTCNNINDCSDDSSVLFYYAYYPNGIDYSECKFPAIILFHAGGFSDCSGLNYEDSLCYVLARKGFIVFNVEYRRGRIKDPSLNGKYTSAQQELAIYRAFQDGRGAIRSIIKRQRNVLNNPMPYEIDTNNIFVAGQSAGACIANSLAYYTTQSMIDQAFPVPAGELSISSALGPIDADYYFGGPGIEYHSKIKGLWSMWGGFPIPKDTSDAHSEYNFLTQNGTNRIPMIGFMGRLDPVFPIRKNDQDVIYPPITTYDSIYTSETTCLINSPFRVYNTSIPLVPDLRMECTNDIYQKFLAHGVPVLEYIDCYMKHGLTGEVNGICTSDFGAAGQTLSKNQVNEYLATRACFFFQSIMNNKASLLQGASKFTDCIDYRHSANNDPCPVVANNNGCTNDKKCD